GRDKPPLVELGVLYEGKERPKPGFQVLDTTPYSHSANLSPPGPGHPRTYLTYRRAAEGAGLHALGVTDLCLVLPSKGEGTPHTYCRLPRNLNPGMWGPAVYLCYKVGLAKANTLVYEAGVWCRPAILRGVLKGQAVRATGTGTGPAERRGAGSGTGGQSCAQPARHRCAVPLACLPCLPR
ncbi:DENND4B isoform 12, partial [Pongo abelii]